MAKKIRFLKATLCIYKSFIVLIYTFFLGAKEKLQNALRFYMDFVLKIAMCSADFYTCVNVSTI